jgi:hypothetical protein
MALAFCVITLFPLGFIFMPYPQATISHYGLQLAGYALLYPYLFSVLLLVIIILTRT